MLSSYKNPQVQQLAWCLSAPPLHPLTGFTPFTAGDTKTLQGWLQNLDANPQALSSFMADHNSTLLGLRFERYLQFFCQYGPANTLLTANLQIHQAGITQGEFDLLYQHQNTLIHLEAAVKFYLCLPGTDGSDTTHWYGPQNHDRLDLKLAKLEQQLGLSRHPAGRAGLQQAGIQELPETRYLLTGMLFSPWPQGGFNPAPVAHRGHWLWHCQLPQLLNSTPHWQLCDKSDWLGPAQHRDALSAAEITDTLHRHFNMHKFARMLVSLEEIGSQGGWRETARYLLVHDNWPLKS